MKRYAIILICAFLFSSCYAIEWGNKYNYEQPESDTLFVATRLTVGVHSSAFVGGVGGISFDQIAQPVEGFTVKTLKVHYSTEQPAGSRLQLKINQQPAKVQLYDWLLIPIIKYADSPYYSCFTLFGKLKDKNKEQSVLNRGGHILNYHPDFTNTLLGLRLYHMDILIMYDHTVELPTENGRTILGKGEVEPDILRNQRGLYQFVTVMTEALTNEPIKYRSYVISDYQQDIRFAVENDSLLIHGQPYYFFWRYKNDHPDYDAQQVRKELSDQYTSELKKYKQEFPDPDVQAWVIRKIIQKLNEYKKLHNFYSGGTMVELLNMPAEQQRIDYLQQFTAESLLDVLIDLATDMDGFEVVHLKQLSEAISAEPEKLRAINPAVWDATVATMRYAAFFRYCKQHFPQQWQALLEDITEVEIKPDVATPTVMKHIHE